MQRVRLAFALALLALSASASVIPEDAEPRQRSLLQRVALRGSPALMAPAEPLTGAEAVVVEAVPVEASPRGQVFLVEHLKTGLRRTYTYALVQKVMDLQAHQQQPHLANPGTAPQPVDPVLLFVSLLVFTLIIAIVAKFYHDKYEYPAFGTIPMPQDDFRAFKHHLCDFYQEPGTCLCALCCPGMRWAQTMFMTGFLGFWAAFGIYFIQDLARATPGLSEIGYISVLCVMTYYRQQLREKFGMYEQGGISILNDCCCYFWCAPCTITQDTRQVEDAYKAGHPAFEKVARDIQMAKQGN